MGSSQLDRPIFSVLVDDQDVVAEGVRSWVAAAPENRAVIVAVGGSIEAALEGPGLTADVVVLDLELGTRKTDSQMVTHRVATLRRSFRVIAFSVHVEA